MYYLFISILCSVSVASLFKILKHKEISIFPIIHFNYILAIFFCYYFLDANYYKLKVYNNNSLIYLALGLLLPLLFLLLNKSILQVGIIKTDIAQRFSLIIPILIAVFVWNQPLSKIKSIGLILAFVAIFLILNKKENIKHTKNYLIPLLVLLGYGTVDVLFKKIALIKNIPYTSSLLFIFTLALFIASLILIIIRKKVKYNLDTIKWGLLLGTLNFINIYTYIKAHQILKDNPTIVFSTMNLGVIILSTIIGFFIFKEKINKLNTMGLILALISIILITLFN